MASQYKKTIILGLDYTQFSGGITECNNKMKVLDAEFGRATAEAGLYGTATDQLRIKQDYLRQKIELQKKVVEESARKLDQAKTSTDSNSKSVDQATKSYAKAQEKLFAMEKELGATGTEYEKTTKSAQSFGDTIRSVTDTLGLSASPAVEKFASMFDGVNAKVGEAIVVIGGLAGAFTGLSKDLADYADELLTTSSVTGLSVETLQELDYAAKLVDVDVSTMSSSMSKLTRSMDDARNGNAGLKEAFRDLRVNIVDSHGELRNAETVFYETIDALGKISNETERDAKAMELFGKSAKELNPLIESGSKQLKAYRDEAKELGIVLDEDAIKKAGEFKDSLDKLDSKVKNLKMRLGEALIPILEKVVDFLTKIPQDMLESIAVTGTVIVVVSALANAIIGLRTAANIAAIANVALGASGATATAGLSPLLVVLIAIAAALALVAGYYAITEAIENNTQKSVNNIQALAKQSNFGGTYNSGGRHFARGTDYFEGGEAWVGEEGPELVTLPRGSRIRSTKDSMMSGTTNIFNVTLDAKNVKDWQDIVDLMENEQTSYRVGRVGV